MVTIEQLKAGITAYIDAEILPRMDGYKKYGLMVYLALLMDDFQNKFVEIMQNPALSALKIMDETGHVNIDKLHEAALSAMRDNVDVTIPIIGRFIFSRNDVDSLYRHIQHGG